MKTLAAVALAFIPVVTFAQEVHFRWFFRTPQVISRNMTSRQLSYSSSVSTGIGESYNTAYAGLGTYVSSGDLYGYFSYVGTTIGSKLIDDDWNLDTNVFGIPSYSPEQTHAASSWSSIGGITYNIRQFTDWGSFGVPLVLSVSYTKSISASQLVSY